MFSVTREVSLDFQWVTASPLFSALPQQGLGWGRVLQEKNLAKDMSACNGKPCKRCGVILDEECYMEWQWAPLYMGPASLPILGIISAFSLVLFYIGIILMFCICAACMINSSMGMIQLCCNCMYRRFWLLQFPIVRKIWEWTACEKCRDCDKLTQANGEDKELRPPDLEGGEEDEANVLLDRSSKAT